MSDLKDVKPAKYVITLGGEKREIRYTYSAWAILEERFGDLAQVMEILQSKPINYLPALLFAGLRVREGIDEDHIRDMLDDLESIGDLYAVLNVMKEAMTSTLPAGKKSRAKDDAPAPDEVPQTPENL